LSAVLILGAAMVTGAALAGTIAARPLINPVRLRHLAKKGSRSARLLERAWMTGNRCRAALWMGLAGCLGVQVAVVSQLAANTPSLPGKAALLAGWTAAAWLLIWLLPMALFRKFPLRLTRRCAVLVWLVSCAFHPLTRWIPVRGKPLLRGSMRESFVDVAKENVKEGGLSQQQAAFLVHLVDFSTTRIRGLMIPIKELVVIEESVPVAEALALAHSKHMDRLILRDSGGEWTGYFDVLGASLEKRPHRESAAYTRRMLSVSESDFAFPVLRKLRASRMALAMVTNAAGEKQGVVFAADIIRELIRVQDPDATTPQK